jgi:hypothetical protein
MKVRALIKELETRPAGSPVKAVVKNAEEIGSFTVEGILFPVPEELEQETTYVTLYPDNVFREIITWYFRNIRRTMDFNPWGK